MADLPNLTKYTSLSLFASSAGPRHMIIQSKAHVSQASQQSFWQLRTILFIMAPDTRRRGSQATSAEISLIHLKNCLVNLPSSLSSLLVNVNTVSRAIHLLQLLLNSVPLSASPKCYYRIELPNTSTCRFLADQWRADCKVHIRGMDRNAKQAQTCTYCKPRWYQWHTREHVWPRARSVSGRD